jgi:hypothetical protein
MYGRAKSLKLVLHLAYYSTVLTCLKGNIFITAMPSACGG